MKNKYRMENRLSETNPDGYVSIKDIYLTRAQLDEMGLRSFEANASFQEVYSSPSVEWMGGGVLSPSYDDFDPVGRFGEIVEPAPSIPYLFNEGKYIAEAKAHIDGTYSTHYAGQIQPTEVIIDAGHGTGFNIGNIIKYAKRYGKKNGYNRADLKKIIHYAVIQLYVHDKEELGA